MMFSEVEKIKGVSITAVQDHQIYNNCTFWKHSTVKGQDEYYIKSDGVGRPLNEISKLLISIEGFKLSISDINKLTCENLQDLIYFSKNKGVCKYYDSKNKDTCIIGTDSFICDYKGDFKACLSSKKHVTKDIGIKNDSEKPDMTLIPAGALTEVIKVLEFGARKYSRDNWAKVPDLQNRYKSAALRHLYLHPEGEIKDPESGFDHDAHVICCMLFRLQDKINRGAI